MIDTYAFLGQPFQFQGLCKIYPPTIRQILEEDNYNLYQKLFLSSQEDIEDEYAEQHNQTEKIPTPFQYLLIVASLNEKIKEIVLKGFNFFIREEVTILFDQQMIVIGNLKKTLLKIESVEELRIINSDNYFNFQNALRRAIGIKELEPYNPDENPRVKYFKAKARLRDRVKAKSKDNLTLASICCMGIGITPLNVGELSQAAISVLMRTYQEKHKYEIDIESLMNGADSKKVKPQFWIRNIEDL